MPADKGSLQGAFAPSTLDKDARTVSVVWATDEIIRRGPGYYERLNTGDDAVDTSLIVGAPFLDSHDTDSVSSILGRVESIGREGGKLTATIKFSSRGQVDDILQDIADGFIRGVSVGYRVLERDELDHEDGVLVDVLRWQPVEISIVAVPADPAAGVRSAEEEKTKMDHEKNAPEATSQEVPGVQVEATGTRSAEAPVTRTRSAALEYIDGVRSAASRLGLDPEDVQVRSLMADDGISLDQARSRLFDLKAASSPKPRNPMPHIVAGQQDDSEGRRKAVLDALAFRTNLEKTPSDYARDAGLVTERRSLLGMARFILEGQGVNTRRMSDDEVFTRSMTTSDLPEVFASTANRSLRNGWGQAPTTYRAISREVQGVDDFRVRNRIALSEGPNLEQVLENGEVTFGSFGDEKQTLSLLTYGKAIPITRVMMINDDIDALSRIPRMFGAAAARLENEKAWALLTANGNMPDGTALFHADHGNLAGSGGAISVTTVGAGQSAMRLQTGPDGNATLNLVPKYLIVPSAKALLASQVVAPIMPAQASNVTPDDIRMLKVIVEPLLDASSTTAWYLACDPNDFQVDVLEHAYLSGNSGPTIQAYTNPNTLGTVLRVHFDYGVNVIDHRGLYKNAGA